MCKKCFLCPKKLIGKNLSKEHIIKNSIGGKKTVNYFICKDCNERTGKEWDYLIDKDFGEILSIQFTIKRQRGKIKPIKIKDKISDKEFLISKKIQQLTPEYLYDESNKKIIISASNRKRCQQYLEQLKGENKIPRETILDSTDNTKEKINIIFEQELKIPELTSNFSKSIVKSPLALLSEYEDRSILESCEIAKDFLSGNKNNCINYFFNYDPIINRPFATPLHCVYIFSEDNILKAYIELFGIARYIITLSEKYNNDKINLLYAINPRNGYELQDIKFDFKKNINKKLHPGLIHEILNQEITFEAKVKNIFLTALTEAINTEFNFNENISKLFIKGLLSDKKNIQEEKFIYYAIEQYKIFINDLYKNIFKQKSNKYKERNI